MQNKIQYVYTNVIQKYLRPTPLQKSEWLSDLVNGNVYLKLECLNPNGSFKVRGALNALSVLYEEHGNKEHPIKVVAASAGNHAQGVAYAAKQLGCEAHIFLPQNASIVKKNATEKLGAKIYLCGANIEEAFEFAYAFCEKEKAHFIHPFNDENIILGQATCALEAHQQLGKEPDFFVCSIGGGGLIAGACLYFNSLPQPQTRLIGVEQELYNSALRSLQQEKRVSMDPVAAKPSTIADGIAIRTIGELPFQHMLNSLVQVQLVSEGAIYDAIAKLYKCENIIAEGAGATALAAVLKNPAHYKNKTTIICVSGSNIDNDVFQKVLHYSKEKL